MNAHRVKVEPRGWGDFVPTRWQAKCSCGWESDPYRSHMSAEVVGAYHQEHPRHERVLSPLSVQPPRLERDDVDRAAQGLADYVEGFTTDQEAAREDVDTLVNAARFGSHEHADPEGGGSHNTPSTKDAGDLSVMPQEAEDLRIAIESYARDSFPDTGSLEEVRARETRLRNLRKRLVAYWNLSDATAAPLHNPAAAVAATVTGASAHEHAAGAGNDGVPWTPRFAPGSHVQCNECDQYVTVTDDGTIGKHNKGGTDYPGSDLAGLPRACDVCGVPALVTLCHATGDDPEWSYARAPKGAHL